jgi:hypothetical protein
MKFSPIAAFLALQIAYSEAFAPVSVNTRRLPSTSLNSELRNLAVTAGKPNVAKASSKKSVAPISEIKTGTTDFIAEKAATTGSTGDIITEKEVRALFELWNSALATGDSRIVADRYIKKPVLLPTVSDEPRTDFDSVKSYFDAFLKKKPQGKSSCAMCSNTSLMLS